MKYRHRGTGEIVDVSESLISGDFYVEHGDSPMEYVRGGVFNAIYEKVDLPNRLCDHPSYKEFPDGGFSVELQLPGSEGRPAQTTGADVLEAMAKTYRERNKVYGDNFKMVAKLVAVLFPNGVPPELVIRDEWHLFELKLVKLSRFAISNLSHIDSVHDDGVYSAMIEAILTNRENKGEQ